jgi:hypothetical protein
MGNAPLTGACAEAAVVCLRHPPAGPKDMARWEQTHDQGKALTRLAHTRARAVSDRRTRQTAVALDTCLQGSGSSAGAPAASRATQAISLSRAGAVLVDGVVDRHGPPRLVIPEPSALIGHPLWLLQPWRSSPTEDVGCPSPAPDPNWPAAQAEPPRCIGR